MNQQEFTAIEGLLSLYSCPPSTLSSRVSLQSYDSEYLSVRLSPISPTIESVGQRLPSIAQVLSSPPSSDAFASATSSMSSLNLYSTTPVCPSMSSSCSTSTVSSISSHVPENVAQQAPRRTLRRAKACIFPANRRGRPRKNPTTTTTPTNAATATTTCPNTTANKKDSKGKKKNANEIKIIKSQYESAPGVPTAAAPAIPTLKKSIDSVTNNKPRWQDAERQTLIEIIVKEKELDNMSSIPWDKVSKVVGRAKKACQDQWRREFLPYLLKGFVRQHQGSFEGDGDSEMTDKQ